MQHPIPLKLNGNEALADLFNASPSNDSGRTWQQVPAPVRYSIARLFTAVRNCHNNDRQAQMDDAINTYKKYRRKT